MNNGHMPYSNEDKLRPDDKAELDEILEKANATEADELATIPQASVLRQAIDAYFTNLYSGNFGRGYDINSKDTRETALNDMEAFWWEVYRNYRALLAGKDPYRRKNPIQ